MGEPAPSVLSTARRGPGYPRIGARRRTSRLRSPGVWLVLATAAALGCAGSSEEGSSRGDPLAEMRPWLEQLDGAGLLGPADGKRALDYEYCIPAGRAYEEQIVALDPTARVRPGSRGRIGCGPDESLVLGSTHQPDPERVLDRLAALGFVHRIVPAWYE